MNKLSSLFAPLGAIILLSGYGLLPSNKTAHNKQQPKAPDAVLVGHSETLLPDGTTLILGGQESESPVATAAILNQQTGTITALPTHLLRARSWHSATLLTDGNVLIFGGFGGDGRIVETPEAFDPETKQFSILPKLNLTLRARHTATLLTDGSVFFAGGVGSDGETLGSVEALNPSTATARNLGSFLLAPRSGQSAALQADGTVLLWGGKSASGVRLDYGEVYDPATNSFRVETALPAKSDEGVHVVATIPEDRTEGVATNILIAIRFSAPIVMPSANSSTITLTGPGGTVTARIVPTERGMLAFVKPNAALALHSTYTLSLSGLGAADGSAISEFSFSFTTIADDSSAAGVNGLSSTANWPGGPQNSPYLKLPPLQAPAGVTAISGQVLLPNGLPLKHVALRVGSSAVFSDDTGRFLLNGVPAGHDELVIDGRTAHHAKETFGVFEVGVQVAAGTTNNLGYTIWMTALDTAHAVKVPFPTTSEVTITNPLLPGLEFHIPANTTITDIDGRVASEISITPIPVTQPPFPLPNGVQVPIYFTIQPGGGYISVAGSVGSKGGRLIYPNTYNRPPGTRFNFWNYDADDKGWYVYGQGSVSQNGRSVIPDSGVEIYELTGAMVANPNLAPSKGPCNCSEEGGDPVDMGTGLFVYRSVDLYEPDVIPIVLSRTYRQGDSATRDFGMGMQNSYDMFLVGDYSAYSYSDLVMADGSEIHFTRTSPGTSYSNAIYQAQSSSGAFFGSNITPCWTLTRKDGTSYQFPCVTNPARYQGEGLLSIRDRNGNTLSITRDSNSNISKITSPNGRWIQFTYDSSNRVTLAQDQSGRSVQYFYDTTGRLFKVIDANNGTWLYGYDSNNNLNSITNPRQITFLQNQYDANGRVQLQTHADGGTYQFSYITQGGNVTETDMTDPNGNVRKVLFNAPQAYPSGFLPGGSPSSVVYAAGTAQQQTFSFQYQAGTNLLTRATDPLGRVTSYSYDSVGNTSSVTHLAGTPQAVSTAFTYDPTFAGVTSVTNPLGFTSSFSYDAKGNLLSATDPLRNTTQFTNDSEGRTLTVTDPANETTSFSYTGADLTSVMDPLNRSAKFAYDAAGRLTTVTTPMGHVTRYAYNSFDQILSVTDPLGSITSFTYGPDKNLLSVTGPQNAQNPVTYSYDSMDRLQGYTDPSGNSESYIYDKNGNIVQLTDRRGKIVAYTYDPLDRLTFIGFGVQQGPPPYESTVGYTYDAGNRLTQAVDSIAGTFTRAYDGLDHLTQEQTPQGSVTYTYDAAGRRTQMSVSGVADPLIYAYDVNGRLTNISQGAAKVAITYDVANRRTSLTLPNGIVASYSYDGGSELLGVNYQLAGSSLGNLGYSYDMDGRRVQTGGGWARTGTPSPTTTAATYNAANEVLTWNGAGRIHDANGNLTSDGANTYNWNARNQLVSISGAATASFIYDPFGRRVAKTVSGATTNYLYDGANPIEELSGGYITASMVSGLATDEYFQRTDARGVSNFLSDVQGSTIALADPNGAIRSQYTYDPFGNTLAQGTPTSSSYQYTGRENDGTGLYYYRGRYYSTQLQRFISEDPIGFFGGDVNLYAYVRNDPLSFTDPLGLSQEPDTNDCKPKCFAQLKYRPVDDWRAKLRHATHSFWYVQDSSGSQYTISAGPTNPNGSGFLNVWVTDGTTGQLPGDKHTAKTAWDSGLSADNCDKVDKLVQAAWDFSTDEITYKWNGPNSNSAAKYLGNAAGFSPASPPGSVGWNAPIPVP